SLHSFPTPRSSDLYPPGHGRAPERKHVLPGLRPAVRFQSRAARSSSEVWRGHRNEFGRYGASHPCAGKLRRGCQVAGAGLCAFGGLLVWEFGPLEISLQSEEGGRGPVAPPNKRSFGTSKWRLGSAIPGSAHFWEALPALCSWHCAGLRKPPAGEKSHVVREVGKSFGRCRGVPFGISWNF